MGYLFSNSVLTSKQSKIKVMKLVKLGVFALALGMFASCGNKAEENKTEAPATTAAAAPAEAPKPAADTTKKDTATAAPAAAPAEAPKK